MEGVRAVVGKRGNRKADKQRAVERERRRRLSGDGQPDLPLGLRRHPSGRPDFTNVPWGDLSAHDAHRLKRAMLIAYVGDQARQANDFLEWGLKPRPVESGSRFAHDDDAISLHDAPNLISSTARYPAMNATENLVAAAQVIAFAITKAQLRTSAVSVLCRTAMESSAKTIWLISEADPAERRRRCFGFIKSERGWQEQFDKIEAETLAARTDHLVAAERVKFQKHRKQFEKRLKQITDLPTAERVAPPKFTPVVEYAADWVDANMPRQPTPDLDLVMMPRGAKSFYSLGSGFVHGYKWATDYVDDDVDLLEMTVDAFGSALRMTEAAVTLFEAQSVGPQPDALRIRNYPAGLADTVSDWAARYI